MAENEVKIKISINSDEALAKFKELKEFAEKICNVSFSGSIGESVGSGATSLVNNNVNSATSSLSKQKSEGKEFGESAATEITKISDRMGRLIGSQIFSAVRRMFSDSTELNYLSNLHAGINTFPIEKQYQQDSAMMQGLFGGAAAGFLVGGPIGSVVGGVGGAFYNRYIAGQKADEQQRLKEEELAFSYQMQGTNSKIDYAHSVGRMALNRALQMTGSREGQIELIDKSLTELKYGEGPSSRQNLEEELDVLVNGNEQYKKAQEVIENSKNMVYSFWDKMFDTETKNKLARVEDAKNNRGEFSGQKAPHDLNSEESVKLQKQISDTYGIESDLEMQKFQTKYLKKFVTPWEGADFADSFSTKGLYAGAQVDMERANEPIINTLKELKNEMVREIRKLTDGFQEQANSPRAELRAPSFTGHFGK